MITQAELKKALDYNQDTGEFTWKISRGNSKYGKAAGHITTRGYVKITIGQKLYYAHRLAWLFAYGESPPSEIDHLNGNKADNRITNLRATDRSMNQFSLGLRSNSTSGVTGVIFIKSHSHWRKPWQANIRRYGVLRYAFFETKEEAIEWRRKMELELFNQPSLINADAKAFK